MDAMEQVQLRCQVCGRTLARVELIPAGMVRPPIVDAIRKSFSGWSADGFICHDDLDRFKAEYVASSLEEEKGELTRLDEDVLKSLRQHEVLTRDLNSEFETKLTFGQRAADKVASFGGSWNFIGIFGGIIAAWIIVNALVLLNRGSDPYPFILLNLVLSCIASIQAPIIMMSQNRSAARDRLQAEHDYRVNLKAELEIRNLHEKMDHLLQHEWQRLLEIQQIQTEMVQELISKSANSQPR